MASVLMIRVHAAEPLHQAPEDVRLRVPIKVIEAGAGRGGINLEVERYGFVDGTGKVVIPAQWDDVSDFHEGFAKFIRNGKGGYIDANGKVVVAARWDNGSSFSLASDRFSEGLAQVEHDQEWGFVDGTGKVVIPVEWDFVGDFHEGLAPAEKNRKMGFIDKSGKVVIPLEWDRVGAFHEGFACIERRVTDPKELNQGHFSKTGYIDKTGKVLSQPQWDWAGDFSHGRAFIGMGDGANRTFGYIETTGKTYFQPEGSDLPHVRDFYEGVAVMHSDKDGSWSLVDTDGKRIILPAYQEVKPFGSGLAAFETKDYKTGFIDKTGKVVIPPIWEGAYTFEDGICWVQQSNGHGISYGVIDTTGKVLIAPEWDEIDIKGGYCFAYRLVDPAHGEDYAWFDKTGRKIWQSENAR